MILNSPTLGRRMSTHDWVECIRMKPTTPAGSESESCIESISDIRIIWITSTYWTWRICVCRQSKQYCWDLANNRCFWPYYWLSVCAYWKTRRFPLGSRARLVGEWWWHSFLVLGREIMLDCNDVDSDKRAGIQTLPVKYGCCVASAVALCSAICMSGIALS